MRERVGDEEDDNHHGFEGEEEVCCDAGIEIGGKGAAIGMKGR